MGGGSLRDWGASHRRGPGPTSRPPCGAPPTAATCAGKTSGAQPARAHMPRWALLQDELTDLALPCTVSGMKEPLVLGISGKPQGLHVSITISTEGAKSR